MSNHKSRLYTGFGDQGQTMLVSGETVSKQSSQVDLYGDVDELNSQIGVLIGYVSEESVREQLVELQHQLFNLGSSFACQCEKRESLKLPLIEESEIKQLESQIDYYDQIVGPMTCFILPGGTKSAAYAHLCRTVARRVERKFCALEKSFQDHRSVEGIFLNRLSDYFFVLARYLNKKDSVPDRPWLQKR